MLGPVMIAVEKRFKAAAIWARGRDSEKVLPQADPMNFAPRVKIPRRWTGWIIVWGR
jgi:hypothetical protein